MTNINRRRLLIGSVAAAGAASSAAVTHGGDTVCAEERSKLARNKQTVREFYDLAFNQSRPADAIARHAGATYTQHNPEVADGKDGFIAYFTAMAKRYGANKRVEFVRFVAEDDLVVVHCLHWFKEWHGDVTWAGIDIFRLDAQGKIVEHWDVLQKVPASVKHGNGMF